MLERLHRDDAEALHAHDRIARTVRRREPVYHLVRNILVLGLGIFFRWRFIGLEKIPRSGPAIIAANHISYFDPLCHAYLVDRARRRPRFFAKAELWKNPFMRFVLVGAN